MPQKQTANIIEYFGELSDPRSGNNVQHPLINIIAIAICGADTWTDIESFGQAKRDFSGSFLDLSKGFPSLDTFGQVFRWLDPEEFGQCFQAWTQAICHLTQGEVVAIDGKCLRGSKDGTLDPGACTLQGQVFYYHCDLIDIHQIIL